MLILAREFHGLTIKDLSARIGVTPSYVCQLESGLKRPSDAIMEQIVSVRNFSGTQNTGKVRIHSPFLLSPPGDDLHPFCCDNAQPE